MSRMQADLAPASERVASRGGDHRQRPALKAKLSVLQASRDPFRVSPVTFCRICKKLLEVCTCAEVLGEISDDQSSEVSGSFLNRDFQHFGNLVVNGIRFGMKLHKSNPVADIDQTGRSVLSNHPRGLFKQTPIEGASRFWHRAARCRHLGCRLLDPSAQAFSLPLSS